MLGTRRRKEDSTPHEYAQEPGYGPEYMNEQYYPQFQPSIVAVIAAHGGVGATTLCRWLGYSTQDWGMSVPPEFPGHSVLVVARGTAHGAARAAELIRYLHALPGSPRIVLAVVADGLGPEPIAARSRLRALSPYVDAVVHVPYVGRWRYVDDPLLNPAPPAYAKALQQLRNKLQLDQQFPSAIRRQ